MFKVPGLAVAEFMGISTRWQVPRHLFKYHVHTIYGIPKIRQMVFLEVLCCIVSKCCLCRKMKELVLQLPVDDLHHLLHRVAKTPLGDPSHQTTNPLEVVATQSC